MKWLLLLPILAVSPGCASNVFSLIEQGKTAELDRLVHSRPRTMRQTDRGGRTPLHVAAYLGRADMVKVLLERGADQNVTDNSGLTPVQIAVSEGYVEVTRLFLENELEINKPLQDGLTLLDFARAKPGNDDVIKLLRSEGAKTKQELYDELFKKPAKDERTEGN